MCTQSETFVVEHVALGRDALCSLESTHALDEPFRVAYERNTRPETITLAPDVCARLCGEVVPAYSCEVPVDVRFPLLHPDVVAPRPPPDCLDPAASTCPTNPMYTGPRGICPFADTVIALPTATLTLSCSRTLTTELCHKAGESHGRRPEGYMRASVSAATPELGAYFAVCAHLEAASVVAFDGLALELAAHGFPDDLIETCSRAAREEVEHCIAMDRLASRFGAVRLPRFVPVRAAPRALVDIAIENAVEGCVGEVFGAAEALFRAHVANDDEVRQVMDRIADEEAGHAELSERIGEVLASRLDDAERARVREATENARHRLRDEIARRSLDPAVVSIAGVPGRADALALFDGLEASIWAVKSDRA